MSSKKGPDPGSEIRDPEKIHPRSGSRIQGVKKHRIPDPRSGSKTLDHKPIYLSFKEMSTQPTILKKGVITNWFLDDQLIKMSAELAALQVYSHSIDSTAHPEIVNDLRLNINVLTAKILDCLRIK
jgi:hypothetical protein